MKAGALHNQHHLMDALGVDVALVLGNPLADMFHEGGHVEGVAGSAQVFQHLDGPLLVSVLHQLLDHRGIPDALGLI